PLKPDDTILIGGYRIKVLNGAVPAQAAPAAAPAAPAPAAPAQAPAPAAAPAAPAAPAVESPSAKAIQEINAARNMVHMKLIQAMDLRRLDVSRMAEQELRETTKTMIDEIIANDKSFPSHLDKVRIGKAVLDEVVGLGP